MTYSIPESQFFFCFQIVSEASSVETSIISKNSKISYGLFSGIIESYPLLTARYTNIQLTCIYGENICFYSCQNTPEQRLAELEKIRKGETLTECTFRAQRSALNTPPYPTTVNSTKPKTVAEDDDDGLSNDGFFSAALHLTTIIFLALTLIFVLVCAIFSIVNVVFNPFQSILSVFGLYIWNGITAGLALLTIILWGSLFAANLSDNIAITDTLRKEARFTSEGLATLGISFW